MIEGKNVLAVCPARGGSKGIKLKNIQPVNGKPMVVLVGDVVKELSIIDHAIVSTDHKQIGTIAQEAGLDFPFTRPAALANDTAGDLEVLEHAICEMEKLDNTHYGIIILLPPTCPLRKPAHVQAAMDKLVHGGFDSVWTVSELDTKTHPLKQLVIKNDTLEYYDKKGATIVSRQQLSTLYYRNGAAYVFTRECLIEQKTIKGKKSSAVIIEDPMVNVDTEWDLELANYLAAKGL